MSLEAGPLRQQSQSLLVFMGSHGTVSRQAHPFGEGESAQEKSHKIQVPEDQRASLSHPVANPLEK